MTVGAKTLRRVYYDILSGVAPLALRPHSPTLRTRQSAEQSALLPALQPKQVWLCGTVGTRRPAVPWYNPDAREIARERGTQRSVFTHRSCLVWRGGLRRGLQTCPTIDRNFRNRASPPKLFIGTRRDGVLVACCASVGAANVLDRVAYSGPP